MINSIIAGISTALFDAFGERYEIFDDEIKQDLKEPCFFISSLNPTHRQILGNRYFRTNNFCIQYFPETDAKQSECLDVAETMTECLEIINTDDVLLRGTKMQYEVLDGVLNFFVNYDYFVYKVEDKTPMENIDISQNVE